MQKHFWNCISGRALLSGAVFCLILSLGMAGCRQNAPSAQTDPSRTAQETTAAAETTGELSVTDLLKSVMTLKGDLEAAIDDLKENDPVSARQKVEGTFRKTETIRNSLNASSKALGDSLPSLQTQLSNIRGLLDLVDYASDKLLLPVLDHIEEHPLSEFKTDGGILTKPLLDYLDLAERLMPEIETLTDMAGQTDLSLVDSEGKIEKYLDTVRDFVELYREDSTAFEHVKAMLGGSGDRLYLVAAQNSAEIRASGGFPGAVGTIRIQNGVLILEDFETVYNVLSPNTPAAAQITPTEYVLFHGGLSAPRDADYCPDFERVAYIWSLGYEERQREEIDGVISATPVIVQKLLAAMEEEIELFDGTVLTGENAVKQLQHDLYYKYFGSKYVSGGATTADQLFADAAKKTADKLMGNFNFSTLSGCLSVVRECIEDRTLMFWMKDGAEQSIIKTLNAHGGLNENPEEPQAGIYYSCTVPSKMGWFLVMDTQVGEGVPNEDGSYTYPITVTFSNDITPEEIKTASGYITGGTGGAIGGSAYFFAPAGGTVSDFTTSNSVLIQSSTYHDLQLGYMGSFQIYADKPVTVTYNLTTAPGVDAPLTLSMTPTVQDYH